MGEPHIGHLTNKEKKMSKVYKLGDSTIAQIVQLIQLGILTGTDISDQMRTLRVVTNDDDETITPDPDYLEMFQESLDKMKTLAEEENES